MREQLINYVNLIFAGNPEAEDIRQEILQNTLDRYDDLISQGKAPQAAYSMAIASIGDISELLDKAPGQTSGPREAAPVSRKSGVLRALAVMMYILCPVPVIILEHTRYEHMVGVPLMLLLVAAATAIMVMTAGRGAQADSPRQKRQARICGSLWLAGTAVYAILSFFTGAWFITWLIFPIVGTVNGIIHAVFDLKEARNHENKCNH